MKIAVRGGHNEQATGSVGYINEVTEDRKVKDSLIKYLRQLGYDVLDVTPNRCDTSTDLRYGVNKANEWGADLFISVHFNAFQTTNNTMGTEVCVYKTGDKSARVVNKLSGLGFKNRGQKVRQALYELRNTKMEAMIVEVCFVDSKADTDLYKRVGSDAVGKAIAEGIANKSVPVSTPPSTGSQTNYPPNGEVQKRGKVIASALNVRSGRGTNYPVIGSLKYGEVIDLYYCLNGWCSMNSKFKDTRGKAVNNFICLGNDKEKYVEVL